MRRVEDDLERMGDLCGGHAEPLLGHRVGPHPEDADAVAACPRGEGVAGGERVRVQEEDGPEAEAREEGEVRGGGDGGAVEGVAGGGGGGGDGQVLWRRHHPVVVQMKKNSS